MFFDFSLVLNAQKARLKLLIAINAGLTGEELRAYMEG